MTPHWRSARVAASRPDVGDAESSAGLESEHAMISLAILGFVVARAVNVFN